MSKVIVERDVDVEMRDGVVLAADVYRPSKEAAYPTLIHRVPYSKSNARSIGHLMINPLDAAQRDYAVVVQDVRGRYNSGGEWYPYVNEMDDGYDTIEWAASQRWSDGNVGIYGSSYMGVTTWHAAIADPPHLKAALPYLAGGNYYNGGIYTNGALELGFSLWWTLFNLIPESVNKECGSSAKVNKERAKLEKITKNITEIVKKEPLTDILPFEQDIAPYWFDWLEHSKYDEYWKNIDISRQVSNLSVPIFQVAGWYGLHLRSQLEMYDRILSNSAESARRNHYLMIGPWTHEAYISPDPTMAGDKEFGIGIQAGKLFISQYVYDWFDHWLKSKDCGVEGWPRVRYFVVQEDDWCKSKDWPPEHELVKFYLHSNGNANSRFGDGALTKYRPKFEISDSYVYDPHNPVPTCGGRTLMPNLGSDGIKNQSGVEEREDVLVYTSPRLTSPLTIAGSIIVTLHAASSAPDTDFTAKLVDRQVDAYCANVAEGIIRARYRQGYETEKFLKPDNTYELSIDLGSAAYTFERGHQIRLEISSSNFPRYDRNPNSKLHPSTVSNGDVDKAVQQIFHGNNLASNITLPVINQ